MSNRISDIPPFKGRSYLDFILHFPSWMEFTGPIDAVLLAAAKETFLAGTKHLGDHFNSFLPTADGAVSRTAYIIESTTDFSTTDVVSGEYTSPVSGTVALTRVLTEDELFGCIPTRISHTESYPLLGENMAALPASGEALTYIQVSPSSGVYYFSMVDDPSLYLLSESYEIVASGELSMRHVEESLEFIPVTGSWYRAMLSHAPDGALSLFDVYEQGVSVTLDHSGTHVEAELETLGGIGMLRAGYAYRDFADIHRVTSSGIRWNIAQRRAEPDMLVERSDLHYETVTARFANSEVASTVLLAVECEDIRPGERARVDFVYDAYVHQEEALSGIYQYDFAGDAHLDSVRIFSENSTYGNVLYYNAGTENLYTSPVAGSTEVRLLNPGEYSMEAGDGKVTVYNSATAISGPFHITYYIGTSRRYNVFARQSYRRSSGDIEVTSFRKDYEITSEGALRPKSILQLTEGDGNVWTMLSSAPLEHFSISVRRSRKGVAHDPEPGNLWILQDNDFLYNLERPARYDVQPRDDTYTHVIDDSPHENWIPSGSYWYKRLPLIDFEQPENPYLLRSMAIYDAFLGILAERDGDYYMILTSRFDPTDITVFPVVGGDTLP